jgi:hypothetical protein
MDSSLLSTPHRSADHRVQAIIVSIEVFKHYSKSQIFTGIHRHLNLSSVLQQPPHILD